MSALRRTGFKRPTKKLCKNRCGTRFEIPADRPFAEFCSDKCKEEAYHKAIAKVKVNQEREKKKLIKESKDRDAHGMKELKQKQRGLPYYKKKCQEIFNKFIRLRDADFPCISCGTCSKTIQYCAGHFYTRGAFPNLRFDEDNVHKQCNQYCNLRQSGNIINYRPRLMRRIGMERFDALESRKHIPVHFTISELQEKIKYYREKVEELEMRINNPE